MEAQLTEIRLLWLDERKKEPSNKQNIFCFINARFLTKLPPKVWLQILIYVANPLIRTNIPGVLSFEVSRQKYCLYFSLPPCVLQVRLIPFLLNKPPSYNVSQPVLWTPAICHSASTFITEARILFCCFVTHSEIHSFYARSSLSCSAQHNLYMGPIYVCALCIVLMLQCIKSNSLSAVYALQLLSGRNSVLTIKSRSTVAVISKLLIFIN
jgi:hypothetical protein